MTEVERIETRPMSLSRLLPWTRLFRGPSLALDARKLLLAALGLILLSMGWTVLDRAFARGLETAVKLEPGELIDPLATNTFGPSMLLARVAEPFIVLVSPFLNVFQTGQGPLAFVHSLLASLWAVVVWGILGGAIARMTAIQEATGGQLGLIPALQFATRRFIAFVGAPLSPLIGIGFFAALCLPIGLLYRIPGNVGATIAGFLGFIPLLAGWVMALLLAGLAIGWPLMTSTVAVESEDAFDALSRSYSYVSQRLGHYAFYVFISWVIGAIGLLVVSLLAALLLHMARWGLSLTGPNERITRLFAGDRSQGPSAAALHAFWVYLIRLLVHGWNYSYFFASSTIIYMLIRKDVDGTPYQNLGGLDPSEEPLSSPMESTTKLDM